MIDDVGVDKMRLKAINNYARMTLCLIVALFFPIVTTASSVNASAFSAKSMPQIVAMVQQGNFERAKRSLKKTLILNPNNSEANYWLAKVYSRLNNDVSALKHLALSHSLEPDRQQISLEYAALLNKLKKYQAAVEVYEKILIQTEFQSERIKITRLLKLAQGRQYAHSGEYNLALKHYQALDLMYPSDVLVLESLGFIYAQLEFWDEAEAYYYKAIDISPDSQSVHFLMAKMHRKLGEAKSKREQLHKVIELESDSANGQSAINILLNDGQKQLKNHNISEAIAEFNTVLEVLPNHLEANLAIASAFENSKSFQQAKNIYLTLEKIYPDNIKIKSRLARLYLIFDKIDDAISQYQIILAQVPEGKLGTDAGIKLSMLYTHKAEYLSKNLSTDSNHKKAIEVIRLWVKGGRIESAQWLIDKVIRAYPKDSDAKYLQGVIYEYNGQLELALQAQIQSVWLNPKNVDARLAYAKLLSSLGNLNEAEAAYRDVLSANTIHVKRSDIEKLIGFTVGERLVRSNKLSLAISHYRTMQKTFSLDVEILQRIADVYVTLGDASEANAVLDEIVQIKLLKKKQKKYFDSGKNLAQSERYKDAYTELKRATKFGNDNTELFYWLGFVASNLYEFDDSAKYYKRSLQLNPDSLPVRESYARSLIKAGKKIQAKEQYEKSYVIATETETKKNIKHQLMLIEGQLLLDEGELEEALAHYQTMNIIFSNDVISLEALANVMVKVGLLAEAKETHLNILRLSPGNTVSYIRLADIAKQQGEEEERLELLSKVINLDAQRVGDVAVKLLLKEARTLIESKNYPLSKKVLNAILSVKPKDRNANQLMAESLVLTGQYDEAESIYGRLLALSPSDLKAREKLAELFVISNRMNYALVEYRKIYDIAPSTEIGQSANAKLNFLYGLEAERLSKNLESESDVANAVSFAKRWIKDDRLDAALWLLSSVVENNTLDSEVFYWLGVIHEKRDELMLALTHVESGLKLNDKHMALLLMSANLNSGLGHYGIAEQQYLRLLPLLQDDDVQRKIVERNYALLIGSRLLESGKLNAALKHFQKVQRANPKDIEVLAKIGKVFNKMELPEKAKSIYVSALRIDPNSAIINVELANLYKQLGDYKAYLNQLRYVFILDPNGGFSKATARDFKLDKGIQQLQKHRWSAAVVAFNRVLETNPNNIFAQIGISSSYLQSGQIEKANQSFNQISHLKNEDINMRLKYLYVKTGYAFEQ